MSIRYLLTLRGHDQDVTFWATTWEWLKLTSRGGAS